VRCVCSSLAIFSLACDHFSFKSYIQLHEPATIVKYGVILGTILKVFISFLIEDYREVMWGGYVGRLCGEFILLCREVM
jgi:hypothetical protein